MKKYIWLILMVTSLMACSSKRITRTPAAIDFWTDNTNPAITAARLDARELGYYCYSYSDDGDATITAANNDSDPAMAILNRACTASENITIDSDVTVLIYGDGSLDMNSYNLTINGRVINFNGSSAITEIGTLEGAIFVPSITQVISSSGNYDLWPGDTGSIVLMTGAGEVGFPDCCIDNLGLSYFIKVRDDSEQIELVMDGDTANDLFVLLDGTELDANDEVDLATNAGSSVRVECLQLNRWHITEQIGATADGGPAN